MARYDELYREIPDPTPVAMPIHFQRPESLTDMMRRMIRTHLSEAAESGGSESFEEANDFEIEDEEPEVNLTRYEDMGSSEEIEDATPGGVESPAQEAKAEEKPTGGSEQPPAATGLPPATTAGKPTA